MSSVSTGFQIFSSPLGFLIERLQKSLDCNIINQYDIKYRRYYIEKLKINVQSIIRKVKRKVSKAFI